MECIPINVNLPPELVLVGIAPVIVITVIVHCAFAFAVAIDGGRLPGRRRPVFVGQTLWFLATLLGGPFVAGLYWVMHHSTICPFVYCECKSGSTK